jgi:pSer/pThr/pTyr-binding forkhead associated (FHA) protein
VLAFDITKDFSMPTLRVGFANALGPGRTLRFGRKTVLVGRSPNCTICLKDPKVSRLHCAITWRPEAGWLLIRHKSAQPVLVNEEAVDKRPLRGGEAIRLGDCTLLFQADDPAGERDDTIPIHPAVAPRVEQSEACLVVESALSVAPPIPISAAMVVMGRGESCDVVLDDRHCSRNHAEIHRVGASFVLRDLGSTNGVFLNDVRVVADVELRPDDLIRMGESRIRFRLGGVDTRPVPTLPPSAASISLATTQDVRRSPRASAAGLRAVGVSLLVACAVLGGIAMLIMPGRRLSMGLSEPRNNIVSRPTRQQSASKEIASGTGMRTRDTVPRPRRPAAAAAAVAGLPGDAAAPSSTTQRPVPSAPAPVATTADREPVSDVGDTAIPPLATPAAAAADLATLAMPTPPRHELPAAAVDAPAVDLAARRMTVPAEEDVTAAMKNVVDAYGDELKPSGDATVAIARLFDAVEESTRPATRYALLVRAEQLAVQAAAYRDAIAVIDMRGQMFQEDALENRLAMLSEAANAVQDGGRGVFDLTVQVARDAMRAERFDVAAKAATVARTLLARIESRPSAVRSGGSPAGLLRDEGDASTGPGAREHVDSSLTMTAQRLRNMIAECRTWQRKYAAAAEALVERPDDPRACDVAGKYLCFVKEDWPAGVAILARGRDDSLRTLAVQELNAREPDAAMAAAFALANAWWDFAESPSRSRDLPSWFQESVRQHAASIYDTVEEHLDDPVDKTIARKRIAECRRSSAVFGDEFRPHPRRPLQHAPAR